MTIVLMRNNSDSRTIKKEIDTIQEFANAVLIENTSVFNPSIILTIFDAKANYMHIPEFGRYYYITDIIALDDNRFRYNCAVDVLYSFKEQILECDTILDRAQLNFNRYLADDRQELRQDTMVRTRLLTGGADLNPSGNCFVITLAGG